MSAQANKLEQFTKQLRVMLGSGVPLVNAIDFLSEDDDPKWSAIMDGLVRSLSHGQSLSKSLAKYPEVFPEYFIGSISSAEMSGQLTSTLEYLEGWLQREADLRARITKSLTYPCTVLVFALLMVLALFNTVIPKLMNSFSSDLYGRSLPTEILMLMTKVLSGPIFYLGSLLLVGLGWWVWRQPPWRLALRTWVYGLPVLGTMLAHVAALRYVSALVLLLESGNQLLPTVRAAAQSSGSPLLLADEARMVNGLSGGESLSELWASRPHLYPTAMVQMASVGENSTSMSGALSNAIPYLEMESHSRLERFVELVEPMLISGVALFIGFVAIAVILPISQITSKL